MRELFFFFWQIHLVHFGWRHTHGHHASYREAHAGASLLSRVAHAGAPRPHRPIPVWRALPWTSRRSPQSKAGQQARLRKRRRRCTDVAVLSNYSTANYRDRDSGRLLPVLGPCVGQILPQNWRPALRVDSLRLAIVSMPAWHDRIPPSGLLYRSRTTCCAFQIITIVREKKTRKKNYEKTNNTKNYIFLIFPIFFFRLCRRQYQESPLTAIYCYSAIVIGSTLFLLEYMYISFSTIIFFSLLLDNTFCNLIFYFRTSFQLITQHIPQCSRNLVLL